MASATTRPPRRCTCSCSKTASALARPCMKWRAGPTARRACATRRCIEADDAADHLRPMHSAGRHPVWITNVKGTRALNTDDYRDACPRWATVVDVDTLAIDLDTGSAQAYQSGGVLTYYPPVDLSGYTARMQVRASVAATDVLLELTTDNGGITLGSDGTVTLQASAITTAALAWTRGMYDLELMDSAGVVTRLAAGSVAVSREVTREDAP